MTTLIQNLNCDELIVISDNIIENILDLSLNVKTRITYLNQYFNEKGEQETLELINRLCTMFQFSKTTLLKDYLYEISLSSTISIMLKIITSTILCSTQSNNIQGYYAINTICKTMIDMDESFIATPLQIETICTLMQHPTYKIESRNYFCTIINNQKINCDYRYKSILSLEHKKKIDFNYFINESAIAFFCNPTNLTLYRLLAGQLLLQRNISSFMLTTIESTILSFATDSLLDYNLRADAADIILRIGSDDNKKIARDIITLLSNRTGFSNTIFDNAQNVHITEIEESVLIIITFLSSLPLKHINNDKHLPFIHFDYVNNQIQSILDKEKIILDNLVFDKNKEHIQSNLELPMEETIEEKVYKIKVDKIHLSLNRIYLDRALYSKYNCTLSHILIKLWCYIENHSFMNEMKLRLLEELIDMSGTCSTGFASRLVNVLSGFGDFNLSISWQDQLISNLNGRLNYKIKNLTTQHSLEICKLYSIKYTDTDTDESLKIKIYEFQSNILDEMLLTDYSLKSNFLNFVRINLLSIRHELYLEFNPFISDHDFDLYFRSAISNYEIGNYV